MRTQSRDTSPAIERIQIAGIRAFAPANRFALVRGMTASMVYANTHAIADGLRDEQRALDFVRRQYGVAWAARCEAELTRQSAWTLQAFDIQAALLVAVALLEQRHILYALTGSLASGVYGLPCGVDDIDLLVSAAADQLNSLANALQADFLWLAATPADTLPRSGERVTLVHRSSLVKLDLIPLGSRPVDHPMLQRARRVILVDGVAPVRVLMPEDVVLSELGQVHLAGSVADDRWNSLLGVLKVQAPMLDLGYLRRQAGDLALGELLGCALMDAGIERGLEEEN